MTDLKILGVKPTPKLLTDMTTEEQIEFIENEYSVKYDMYESLTDLDKSCTTMFNKDTIIECRKQIPKDPLWIHYSMEAWTLNESIKAVLDKFKKFFPKVFNYIGSFVIIRTKAARLQCEKWFNILKDQNKDQDKIDKIFNDSTIKTAKVEFIANVLNSAAVVYQKISEQANNIKGLKGVGSSDADKEKLQKLFEMPPEYNKFLEDKKFVDDATPSNDDKKTFEGFTYKDGGWADPAKIAQIVKALDHVTSVMENIKRLQAVCDETVRSLEKEQKGESAEQNLVKDLNNQKIKFLRELSKKILSDMMGTIGKIGSLAANNCRAFCNQYEKDNN